MENHIYAVLKKYNHHFPFKPQHSPHRHWKISYGATQQLVPDDDTSPALDITGIRRVQGIVGVLLYYGREVDNKLIIALSVIGTQQTKETEATAATISQLLEYVATYPNNGITYRSRNMHLAAHSDAAYLNISKACSHAGAHILI